MSEIELAKVKLIDTIGMYNLTASNIAKFKLSKLEENVFATMMVEFAQELANGVTTGAEQCNLPVVVGQSVQLFCDDCNGKINELDAYCKHCGEVIS